MMNNAPLVSSVTVSPAEPLNPADAAKAAEAGRRADVNRKLNRSVRAVVDRLRNKEALTSVDEAGFVRDGKAEVQVWLTEKSEANLAKLKELGFEVIVNPTSPKLIIGRISIDKLEALAELTFVSYVSPQVSK
jgi:riboflavin biosynthesis pyrimidine reductase